MKVEIEESKLQTAYANACDGVKDFMESLFGKKVFEAAKPTLDDYKTIRTYEDACVALKQDAIRVDSVNRDTTTVLTNGGDRVNMPSHIVALMKLETISRALWGRDFQPKPDGEGSKVYWYPWFALYTKKEINDMYPEQRGALLSAGAAPTLPPPWMWSKWRRPLEKNRGLSTPQSILICVPRPDKTWSWRPSGSTALPVW